MSRPLPAGRRLPLWALGPLVAVLTALQMVRRPTDPPLWDSLFVEDGGVFLSNALNVGFLDTLTASYFGYLHTLPRLIADATALAPIEDAPLVMSLLTSLVVALLAVYVFEASGAWIASLLLRAVLGLAVVFVPVTAHDISGSVSNLHWYLTYAAAWAVICPWRSRRWLAASAAVVLAAVLSDPITGVLLPVAIVFAVRARARHAWVMPVLLALGLLAQLVLRDESAQPFGGHDWAIIPRTFAERVTTPLFVGDRYLVDVFGGKTGSPFAWTSLAVVALGVGFGLWRLRGRRAWLLAGGATLSIVCFLIPTLTRGTFGWDAGRPWGLGSTRYTYLPVMFLLTGLLAALDRREKGGRRPPVREIAVAVLVVATMVAGFDAPHRTSGQARWSQTLSQARLACRTEQARAPIDLYIVDGRLMAVVPVNGPPGWDVKVPCSRLE